MLIREASDLHTEFWKYNKLKRMLRYRLPPLPEDKDTVLVLAGDIGTFRLIKSTILPTLEVLAQRFKHVLYTYGNHEWYYSCFWGSEHEAWKGIALPDNVTILQNDYKIIDDVAFIGATLWTDFDSSDELAIDYAKRGMNDFLCIRTRFIENPDAYLMKALPVLTPAETVKRHYQSRQFILDSCRVLKDLNVKTVVITHHCPSEMSIHSQFEGSLLNAAFYSNLDSEIELARPDLWFHGHTHNSFDYMLHKTRVICNPFGYHNSLDQNKKYNPKFIVEL